MLEASSIAVDSPSRAPFVAPALLRNPHLQNIAASSGLRLSLLTRRARKLGMLSTSEVLDCGQGVRLAGELSIQPGARGMVILLHGWEGSSQSGYVVSAAIRCFEAGYSVFRLNFRDHGETHHLNAELFNSARLEEVIAAVAEIQQRWPHPHTYLAGYSLGGNFALRLALAAPAGGIRLRQVAAICPVIDPARTLEALEASSLLYHRYFVGKWRRSLMRKLHHFPHYAYAAEVSRLRSLSALHDFFVPRFTDFSHRNDYFQAYALTQRQLESLTVPCTIINSLDDPITRADFLPELSSGHSHLQMELTQHGSHCAFLKDFRFSSWVDDRLLELFH